MQSIKERFSSFTQNIFSPSKVYCAKNEEEVEIENPNFAQLDPHLSYDESQDQEFEQPGLKGSRRPPNFDGLMNNIKAITKKYEHIKGFKFEIVMAGSPNFHVSNSWVIPNGSPQAPNPMAQQMPGGGKQQKAHYGLNVQYVGGSLQQLMQQKFPPFIMTGRWDSTGKLECALIKKLRDNVQLRFQAAYPTGSDLQYAQMFCELDVEGDDYLHTLKYGTGLYSFNHMQTIGRNLVLGFEWMNLIDRKISCINYAAKYTHKKKHQFYGQYVALADLLSVAYCLNLKKRTHLVSELNINPTEGTTNTVLGYQQRFSNSEVIATINSKGKISTSLNILGMSYALKLCANADYMKDTYKFGYGLSIGQQH